MTADAVGGVWQYSLSLLRSFAVRGYTSKLLVFGPAPTSSQCAVAESIPNLHLEHSPYALEWMPDTDQGVSDSGNALLSLADAFKPDIVHLNSYYHASLPFACPKISVAHSCVAGWFRAVRSTAPTREWDAYCRKVRTGLDAADAVVAPSSFMASALFREYGFRGKVSVIHNFSDKGAEGRFCKKPFCLASGRLWDEAKNLQLLESVASGIEWPIVAIGDCGPTPQSLLELRGRVSHADALSLTSQASIFIHPALYEPFGLAVLEAAQRACCLLLADIDSLRELWGDAAIYASPRDASEWKQKLRYLIENPDVRERMGQKAAKHALRYSEEKTVASYRSLYGQLSMETLRTECLVS